MPPKKERLTKEDFKKNQPKIFFRGEMFDVSFFVLSQQKFACVISKKTLKRAVDRNKVKRRIMSAIQKTQKEGTIKTKKSLIVYPKRTSLIMPYQQLYSEIQKVFATLD
jgi:ribonuclease P protein component